MKYARRTAVTLLAPATITGNADGHKGIIGFITKDSGEAAVQVTVSPMEEVGKRPITLVYAAQNS